MLYAISDIQAVYTWAESLECSVFFESLHDKVAIDNVPDLWRPKSFCGEVFSKIK